ncbi:MAG: MmcQ/YjbR family DNA-binding protein [Microbacteriaceae bacterium]|nr:MmcQ/YjbR family DNA-binding protein [Microbacteriaceae bacterium]
MVEPHPQVVDPRHPLVVRLRELCLRFPEAVEVEAWGRPTFRAGKKIFAFAGASMDAPLTMVFKPDPEDAPALRQDVRVFSPPYFGPSGWLAIELDSGSDWAELAELVDASYRQVALVRQVRALDAAPVVR